ncbi:hypothetical protein FE257_010332 [Aspergillus nanangensis]|uniref:Uncharacterized protein n=1 Tax=Aspergillus nanangensis TaxID=2582783 RepID=A0AAD4GS70_ASPNN|nr:hypothetical protein FE257_010332 [Aspergillus nanangensis]
MSSSSSQHHHHHQLTSPPRPLALRPEYVANSETILTVTNRAEPWHSLDYLVECSGQTAFTVCGQPWSLGQRKVFNDRSGLPLFELRERWYDSSVMVLSLPGGNGSDILSAKLRVAVKSPTAVVMFKNAAFTTTTTNTTNTKGERGRGRERKRMSGARGTEEEEVRVEVFGKDLENLVQVVVVEGCFVAAIERVTDPKELLEGQRPPFRLRPKWRVRVAAGMDLSLIAVIVVIVGGRTGGDVYSPGGVND